MTAAPRRTAFSSNSSPTINKVKREIAKLNAAIQTKRADLAVVRNQIRSEFALKMRKFLLAEVYKNVKQQHKMRRVRDGLRQRLEELLLQEQENLAKVTPAETQPYHLLEASTAEEEQELLKHLDQPIGVEVKNEATAAIAEVRITIQNQAEAMKYLRALQEYAMLQENFRAIGLLMQAENVLSYPPDEAEFELT